MRIGLPVDVRSATLVRGVAATVILALATLPSQAQQTITPIPPQQAALPPSAPPPAPVASQAEIAALVAPVALYPDQLLSQILMAATYPLEVVEADRWRQDPGNAALRGDALADALAPIDWDPSVKSLVPFPQVLSMMDQRLDWTQRLGDAFRAQPGEVMDTVQRLRHQALADGTLRSSSQIVVRTDGDTIYIDPASPQVVYVPIYDPARVYGAWPYPAYPPYPGLFPEEFYPSPILVAGLAFTTGFVIVPRFWHWSDCDWSRHRIVVDRGRVDAINASFIRQGRPHAEHDTWRFDPHHARSERAATATAVAPAHRDAAPSRVSPRSTASAPAAPARIERPVPADHDRHGVTSPAERVHRGAEAVRPSTPPPHEAHVAPSHPMPAPATRASHAPPRVEAPRMTAPHAETPRFEAHAPPPHAAPMHAPAQPAAPAPPHAPAPPEHKSDHH